METSDIVFWICFAVSVPSALMVVLRRNPVYGALSLLVCFLTFAVVYLLLGAPFLAAVHVIVYTGAILVLFLFVIMLLNLKDEELGREFPRWVRGTIGVACAAAGGGLVWLLAVPGKVGGGFRGLSADFGGVRPVGRELFQTYVLHFELVGILLLVAMIGAMVMAKRKI